MPAPAVSLRGITRRFGTVVANDDVSLDLAPGEIHALVGENGAGKSTLMQVLYGLLAARRRHASRSTAARCASRARATPCALGLGMVHQHFMLVDTLTVAENVTLGREPRAALGAFRPRAAERAVAALAERYGLPVDPHARIAQLSVGEQQRVEILKALYRGARVLILDEPTAVLTPQEVDELFAVLRALRAERHRDRAHHAQARRGDGARRPRHGDARAAASWAAARSPDCTTGRIAELMVGHVPAPLAGALEPRAGRGRARGRATSRCATPAGCPRCAACRSPCARARSSASPASRATASTSWSSALAGLRAAGARHHRASAAARSRPRRARAPRGRARAHPERPAPPRAGARDDAGREPGARPPARPGTRARARGSSGHALEAPRAPAARGVRRAPAGPAARARAGSRAATSRS